MESLAQSRTPPTRRRTRAADTRRSETHPRTRQRRTELHAEAAVDSTGVRTAALAPFAHLFAAVPESMLLELAAHMEPVHITSGDTLLHQGEPGSCVYLVVNGRLRLSTAAAPEHPASVADVGRGDMVGDVALLMNEPQPATIQAVRDSELLRLSREAFERLITKCPETIRQLARVNLVRLRQGFAVPRDTRTLATVAVVPAGCGGAPVSEFAASLAMALSAFGPTLHVNKAEVDRGYVDIMRAGIGADCSVIAWLNEQETRYRYIVYEADATWSPWTRRCLRQADRVIAVGVAGADPALGEIESHVASAGDRLPGTPRDLVLLHSADAVRPTGTDAWLARRRVDAHYHVRVGRQADYDRLARFVTGRAVGLVLGGGGARGMAHIGALRAIQELGIPIDVIGGTSSGAGVAAAVAKGLSWEHILDTARELLVCRGSLLDFTVPVVSLVTGRRISRALQRTFEDVAIEDLWLNYFCVSTNLNRAQTVVHRRGLLWKAVRASVSLPGILPPVPHEGSLLIDGGVMNKLPVDVMRRVCNGGRVLAVSVGPAHDDLEVTDPYGEHLSGWGVLCRRLNPFRARRAGLSIARILLSSTLLKSAEAQESLEREADLCVRVAPLAAGLFDFRHLDAIVESGYHAARDQLAQWSSVSG
jgi:predicted acylesterase/phospholipase RssA